MARELSALVPEGQVITSRDGRGGAQGGADLLWLLDDGTVRQDVLGWSVECKTTEGLFPTPATWDKWWWQALGDSGVHKPVILYHQHGRRDCWAAVESRDDFALLPLDVWMRRLAKDGEV